MLASPAYCFASSQKCKFRKSAKENCYQTAEIDEAVLRASRTNATILLRNMILLLGRAVDGPHNDIVSMHDEPRMWLAALGILHEAETRILASAWLAGCLLQLRSTAILCIKTHGYATTERHKNALWYQCLIVWAVCGATGCCFIVSIGWTNKAAGSRLELPVHHESEH